MEAMSIAHNENEVLGFFRNKVLVVSKKNHRTFFVTEAHEYPKFESSAQMLLGEGEADQVDQLLVSCSGRTRNEIEFIALSKLVSKVLKTAFVVGHAK